MTTTRQTLRTLSPDECLELIEPGGIGRVGFAATGGVIILPVNFVVIGKVIVFRTAPDALLAGCSGGQVSFEVDEVDEALREGWSVLVRGHAHKVTDERAVRQIEDRAHLEPWADGARDVYVRIAPSQISGRRIKQS